MKKILVPLVNRTNYSKLRPVLQNLHKRTNITIVLSSSAALKDYGNIRDDVEKDGFYKKIIVSDSCLRSDSHVSMNKNIALSMIQGSILLEQEQPDLVLIVGDRFDMLPHVISSAIQNVPIAHIQGGERSGTIDDKIRFAITALSDYHFPATHESTQTVIRAGADPNKVYNYGCPAVEHINKLSDSTKFKFDDLEKYSKRSLKKLKKANQYILVQVHPNTVEGADVNMKELLSALEAIDMPSIILYPNIDATSSQIMEDMRKYRQIEKFYYYKHFSLETFVGLMKNCECFIGNSSSIIRESALFRTPAINLGTRQRLRESNNNVFDCDFNKNNILELFYSLIDKIMYTIKRIVLK